MALIEIQRITHQDAPLVEVLIGKHLDQPYQRIHAAKLTRFRDEAITIAIPTPYQPMSIEKLREHIAFSQQVLLAAEQFQSEYSTE